MLEYTPPRIESTYIVDSNTSVLESLRDAAVEYDQTRPIEEGFIFETSPIGIERTFVVFGRSVIVADNYAEIGRKLDLMQLEIESHITDPADRAIVLKGRAGLGLYGSLPD